MKKIVNPCKCEIYNGRKYNAFCRIDFTDGKLSITGVVGPLPSGNCRGSAGQCADEIRKGEPTEGWTPEMLTKFCEIWDEWHLNDTHPECEHQRELGWRKIAGNPVYKYTFLLTEEADKMKKAAEKASLDALKAGETFTPTEEQKKYANLKYSRTVYSYLDSCEISIPENYRFPQKNSCFKMQEVKRLGWLCPEEFEDGILTKPCPVCGYKYGTSFKRAKVPEDVIQWLFDLPDTKIQPAWV